MNRRGYKEITSLDDSSRSYVKNEDQTLLTKHALLYADGSKSIGMGHLSRLCLLYDFLMSHFGFQAKLVLRKDSLAQRFVSNRNVETVFLKNTLTDNERNMVLYNLIESDRPSLLALDVLTIDSILPCIEFARGKACRTIVIIDNTRRKEVDADIVLNGNPAQINQNYSMQPGNYLLGPKYFLMDEAYASTEVAEPNGEVKRILLTLGGSDHNNLLFRILNVLKRMNRDLSVSIVTSKASGYIEQLNSYLKTFHFSNKIFVDVPSLVRFWEHCDLAITAGGNTLFERIASRLPGATVCQLNRQMELADHFESLGVNCNIGFGPRLTDDVLLRRIAAFFSETKEHLNQYIKAPLIVDGKGLIRIGEQIKLLFKEGGP